jgi:integrase
MPSGRAGRRSIVHGATLRAALNHAFNEGKVDSDIAWRKLKPFRRVENARVRYLSVAESKRLINACDPTFRPLVQAALQSGARYSELARLVVSDLNLDAGTLHIRTSKAGKARHIVLTSEGQTFFAQLTAGRSGDDPMFHKAWAKSQQTRPMTDACHRSKIRPPASFHTLRHTWASLAVRAGMPLMVVAQNLGHADTRMVRKNTTVICRGHMSWMCRTQISRPTFGFGKAKGTVTPLRKAGADA